MGRSLPAKTVGCFFKYYFSIDIYYPYDYTVFDVIKLNSMVD